MPPTETTAPDRPTVRLTRTLELHGVTLPHWEGAVDYVRGQPCEQFHYSQHPGWMSKTICPARIVPVPQWLWDLLGRGLFHRHLPHSQSGRDNVGVRVYELEDLVCLLGALGLDYVASVDSLAGVIDLDILAPLETRHAS